MERRIDMIDVSHFQGEIDFSKLPPLLAFCCKATQGTSRVDPMFQRNWAQARLARIPRRIAYHFVSGDDAETQARFFAQTVGATQPGDGVMLDVEPDLAHGVGNLHWDHINNVADVITRLMHLVPFDYVGQYYPGSPPDAKYPWILPHYGTPNWNGLERDPVVWQWSSKQQIPGIVGNVDVNTICDLNEFDRFLVGGFQPPVTGGKKMVEFTQLDDSHPPEEHYPVFLSSDVAVQVWMQTPQQYQEKLFMLGFPPDHVPHQCASRADLEKWGVFLGPLPPGWTA